MIYGFRYSKFNFIECNGRMGFFPHSLSCQKFLFCNGLNSSVMTCPFGYYFNDSCTYFFC